MSLTLVQLETFMRLAALGNFTRVAEERFLTQPAVTQQIRALERHFKLQLVEVVGHQPELTEAGRFLAARAGDLLTSVAALEHDMTEFAEARAGELRLGATLTIGTYALPSLLARFTQKHAGVHLHVEVANTSTIAHHVHTGALNLGLIEGSSQDEQLEHIPYQHDHLILVVSPQHAFAQQESITQQELIGEPMVWREPGSGTRLLVEQALAAAGIIPHVVLELPSGEGVARAVEAGLGIAFLSPLTVERAIAEKRLAAVAVTNFSLQRVFQLIIRHRHTLSPAAQAFKDFLYQEYLT
ncbi:MAG TPA: LysR family transcriptional regulator [Ktedonobacteraceae bacterium]|jgi:DNA-binding transcriptional LysR family regulator|nr:LysR family transcriptional regulator [Ktedonobacteraceae bacterium]